MQQPGSQTVIPDPHQIIVDKLSKGIALSDAEIVSELNRPGSKLQELYEKYHEKLIESEIIKNYFIELFKLQKELKDAESYAVLLEAYDVSDDDIEVQKPTVSTTTPLTPVNNLFKEPLENLSKIEEKLAAEQFKVWQITHERMQRVIDLSEKETTKSLAGFGTAIEKEKTQLEIDKGDLSKWRAEQLAALKDMPDGEEKDNQRKAIEDEYEKRKTDLVNQEAILDKKTRFLSDSQEQFQRSVDIRRGDSKVSEDTLTSTDAEKYLKDKDIVGQELRTGLNAQIVNQGIEAKMSYLNSEVIDPQTGKPAIDPVTGKTISRWETEDPDNMNIKPSEIKQRMQQLKAQHDEINQYGVQEEKEAKAKMKELSQEKEKIIIDLKGKISDQQKNVDQLKDESIKLSGTISELKSEIRILKENQNPSESEKKKIEDLEKILKENTELQTGLKSKITEANKNISALKKALKIEETPTQTQQVSVDTTKQQLKDNTQTQTPLPIPPHFPPQQPQTKKQQGARFSESDQQTKPTDEQRKDIIDKASKGERKKEMTLSEKMGHINNIINGPISLIFGNPRAIMEMIDSIKALRANSKIKDENKRLAYSSQPSMSEQNQMKSQLKTFEKEITKNIQKELGEHMKVKVETTPANKTEHAQSKITITDSKTKESMVLNVVATGTGCLVSTENANPKSEKLLTNVVRDINNSQTNTSLGKCILSGVSGAFSKIFPGQSVFAQNSGQQSQKPQTPQVTGTRAMM